MPVRHFDVLVLGAGTAGSIVASRLSEDAACKVGLIEAGEMPRDPDIADPLKWTAIQGRDYDWAYQTVPQRFTAGRVHEWARGKIVGGSSCLHAMAYVRGHADDFEPWRAAGGDRWSYDGLLPAFKRAERFTAFPSPLRGASGPLDVYLPDEEVSPVVRAYIAAGRSLGAPVLSDHNSGEVVGTTPNSLNIRNGRRVSLADAYLTADVLERPNLTLLTGFEVDHIVHSDGRAVAVAAMHDGASERISFDRLVICTGSIGTPLLLMRSGIGNPDVMKTAGLDCVIDNREIGANLQDHLLALGNVYRSTQPVPPSRLQHSESLMYLHSDDVTRSTGSPDMVLGCVVAPSAAPGLEAPAYGSAFTILCGVTHPTSRGHILPGGPNRTDTPIIDPHYLETEHDRRVFRQALRIAREVGRQPALDAWRAEEVLPGPLVQSDADLDAFIARAVWTHHHPCGTCRMGADDGAVVTPDLRLNGLDNAFVVDASIIPEIPCGPINAAVVAIAETWSEFAPTLS